MPLIDSRGRVFGAVNLLDLALILFVVLLIPIAATTYRIFRVPAPTITAVTPSTVRPGGNQQVVMTGEHFQPYLRVFFDRKGDGPSLTSGDPARTEGRFLVETPTSVEVKLPDLPAGVYDLRLFDEGRQVAERLGAVTVSGGPPATVETTVHFVVSDDLASIVAVGDEDTYAPAGPPLPSDQPNAVLKSLKPAADADATALHMASQQEQYRGIQERGKVLEAVVSIPVVRGDSGRWEYKRQAVRAGDTLRFETQRYAMYGVIHRVAEQ